MVSVGLLKSQLHVIQPNRTDPSSRDCLSLLCIGTALPICMGKHYHDKLCRKIAASKDMSRPGVIASREQ